jgi:hypothetical protein
MASNASDLDASGSQLEHEEDKIATGPRIPGVSTVKKSQA